MLFGPRITTVFRSRWRALFFAASVLVSTYFYVQPKEKGEDASAAAALVGAFAPQPAATPSRSPWAPDPAPAAAS